MLLFALCLVSVFLLSVIISFFSYLWSLLCSVCCAPLALSINFWLLSLCSLSLSPPSKTGLSFSSVSVASSPDLCVVLPWLFLSLFSFFCVACHLVLFVLSPSLSKTGLSSRISCDLPDAHVVKAEQIEGVEEVFHDPLVRGMILTGSQQHI